ncbi:MAG: DNA alkylation repair protein [Thermodesulfobacteriota bacterium]
MSIEGIRKKLKNLGSVERAKVLQRFFKTGPGEYGEGDLFLGIRVPVLRGLAKEHEDITKVEAGRMLRSAFHEERLLALLILVRRFSGGDLAERRGVYDFYMKKTRFVNNWDLVDLSAPNITGAYLFDKEKKPLYEFAASADLWKRRISIVATHYFIKNECFEDTLNIAEILVADKEDLIHKAAGWMLREVAKRDKKAAAGFLKEHYKHMPRTMLRYAIERFPEDERQGYLKGSI